MPASYQPSTTPDEFPTPPGPTLPGTTVGRVVVVDVAPVVLGGRRPAKAVVGEDFEVSATVFREGPDVVGAGVVLTDPEGRPGRWVAMREVGAGSDRFSAGVSAGVVGDWSFRVEGWSDPVASWWRSAGARLGACPGEAWLVWEEGARLLERAAVGVPEGEGRGRVRAVAEALRARAGGGAGDGGGVGGCLEAVEELLVGVLGSYPLRELVSCSESLPLRVERERALYGAWYEFFPRSEGTRGVRTGRCVRRVGVCRGSRGWVSTWCICRRFIRSGSRVARGGGTR